jgi:hypothetical protein
MRQLVYLIFILINSTTAVADTSDDKMKAAAWSHWASKFARDFKCAALVKTDDDQAYNFYLESIETRRQMLSKELFGYAQNDISAIVAQGKRDSRKLSKKIVSKQSCLTEYHNYQEMISRKPRDGSTGNCILSGSRNYEDSILVLEKATDFKVVGGFRSFTLPEGYTTDNGQQVYLKNEVMIYKLNQRNGKKIFIKEIDEKIYVREEDYIILDGKQLCVESSFSLS